MSIENHKKCKALQGRFEAERKKETVKVAIARHGLLTEHL